MDKPERIPGTHPRQPAFGPRFPKAKRNPFYCTTRWLKLSKLVRAEQMYCILCHEPSTHVDHMDGDTDNNKRHNLVGLCDSCHSWKTNAFDKQPNGKLKYVYSVFQFDRFASRYIDKMPDGLRANPAAEQCDTTKQLEDIAQQVWHRLCAAPKQFAHTIDAIVAVCNMRDVPPFSALQYSILRAAYQTRGM